jgi:PTH1 family peptidyl-tRNA hydrolase
MKLIFGLGNRERNYSDTRHNVGVMVIQELARQQSMPLKRTRRHAWIGQTVEAGETIFVVQSRVHMNCSGQVLRDLVEHLGVPAQDLLPVYDDFHLELGRLRFRRGGSSAGHQGVESIIDWLGTTCFPRLRIGIGPPEGDDAVEFVLSPFTKEQRAAIGPVIARAAEAAWQWATEGIEACMNLYN